MALTDIATNWMPDLLVSSTVLPTWENIRHRFREGLNDCLLSAAYAGLSWLCCDKQASRSPSRTNTPTLEGPIHSLRKRLYHEKLAADRTFNSRSCLKAGHRTLIAVSPLPGFDLVWFSHQTSAVLVLVGAFTARLC